MRRKREEGKDEGRRMRGRTRRRRGGGGQEEREVKGEEEGSVWAQHAMHMVAVLAGCRMALAGPFSLC